MPEDPTRGYTLDEVARLLSNGSISRGRALKLMAAMAVAAVVPARLAAAAGKKEKFKVCHKGKKTLTVGSQSAYEAHLAHGDTAGPCPKTTKPPKVTTTKYPVTTTTKAPVTTTTKAPVTTTTKAPKPY